MNRWINPPKRKPIEIPDNHEPGIWHDILEQVDKKKFISCSQQSKKDRIVEMSVLLSNRIGGKIINKGIED